MTLQGIEGGAEPGELIGLLQPFIDGELEGEEHRLVAEEVERNPEYRAIVERQRRVQSLLRGLERDVAPVELRARVIGELDAADQAKAEAEASGWAAPIVGRIKAFGRGSLLMVPAAAAAVALFVLVRTGTVGNTLEGLQHLDGMHVDGGMASSLHVPKKDAEPSQLADGDRASERPAAPESADRALAVPSEQGFSIQVAPARSLPEGTALVSDDGPGTASSAMVRYRDAAGALIVDRQRPAHSVTFIGTRQVFSNHTYHLSRDGQGRARVEFSLGPVHHTLTLEGAEGRPGAGVATDEPDFVSLLAVGEALRHAHGP